MPGVLGSQTKCSQCIGYDIRCGGEVLTRCRSKVHDTFDTIQHVGGFLSGHRHIVHGIRSFVCRELGLRTHLTSLCAELVEILSGCTGHGGYLAHRRIKIGVCFYSSNAKSCNCSRGRKELFAGGGNLIACGLQAFTSSSNLLHSSGRLICLCLQLFEIFFRFDNLPLKSIVLFFGNVTICKCLICLLCSSLESSELFLCFTDGAGEEP